ncbi:hypothetical protein ACFSKI_21425 [Pseudogracilibacillus auburnensis]|uniref:Uncharacterized protein n=1 Tax=Pseudogracilibacillus auburnensis TaxID=1494959 RepID=A0A2V3VIH8_9BACI|nr:hypothetical protein [Pseudogracilibacillus auburnensis]PXW81642.1 hypothetical protein DFR56_12015 [Pseudogracilibacillus auburnensis]
MNELFLFILENYKEFYKKSNNNVALDSEMKKVITKTLPDKIFKKDMSGFYLSLNQETSYLQKKIKGKNQELKWKK